MDWRKLIILIGLFIVGLSVKNTLVLKSLTIDWKYRMPIYIYETGGKEYRDVPILLEVNTLSLINLGKMRPDCGDIRFYYLNTTTNNLTKIPYWIQEGCGTANTKIWIKVPYIPANGNITIYMYYGNPRATSESNKTAFPDVEVVIGETFKEHTLNNINHVPKLDIYNYMWKDAGKDTFDGYGYTRMYASPSFTGESYMIVIRPYELGEIYKFQFIEFSDGRRYIIYKDMLPGKGYYSTQNAVLRIIILPANELALEKPYSIRRWGDLGYDWISRLKEYTFTCSGKTYRYYMTHDIYTDVRKGKPHVFYFMFCIEYPQQYKAFLRYDDLREDFRGKGLCALYLAPTDNPLGDSSIETFLCEEIKYLSKFKGKYFKVEGGIIYAVGIEPPETIQIKYGTEERISTEPDVYRGIDIQVSDTYERGELATIYAKVDLLNVTPTKVTLEILDYQGRKVYGPVNMTEIAPYIYSYTFNTSVLEPGTYLVRVLIWLPDNRIFGGVAPIKIQIQFAELKRYISEEVGRVYEYLKSVIYPKLLEIETKVDNLTQFSYEYLTNIKTELEITYNEVKILQEQVKSVNVTLYNKLLDVENKTITLLRKVDEILSLIRGTVISYLEGISTNINTLLDDISYLKQRVDNTIVPKLNIIETYLKVLNKSVNELNLSIREGFKEINSQIEVLRDTTDRILLYIEQTMSLLRCENIPENSVCAKLEQLRTEILDIKTNIYDIKTTVTDLKSYIENILIPKIDEIFYNTQAILNNQTKIYNKLVEAYQEIQKIKEISTNVYNTLQDTRSEILSKLAEQSSKLDNLNTTVYTILSEIRRVVIPKIDSIESNITKIIEILNFIKGQIICEENATLCAKINTIIGELETVKSELSIIKEDVRELQPLRADLSSIYRRVRGIQEDIKVLLETVGQFREETQQLRAAFETVQKDIEEVFEKLEGRQITAAAILGAETERGVWYAAIGLAILLLLIIFMALR